MEITTTERGGKKLCLNGFMCTLKNEAKYKKMKLHGAVSEEQIIPARNDR